MQFNSKLQKKHLKTVLTIIRQGIHKQKSNLDTTSNEPLTTQTLVDEFNIIGTKMKPWIGAQKERVRPDSRRREDIYFYLDDDDHTRIFFAEAKRLPKADTKVDEEYVIGTHASGSASGGIERYKLLQHGTQELNNNGMIAYVENHTLEIWLDQVNQKIKNTYPDDTQLELKADFENEFVSIHQYSRKKGSFMMHHFWIDLT